MVSPVTFNSSKFNSSTVKGSWVGAVIESALRERARISPRADKALILDVNFAGALGRVTATRSYQRGLAVTIGER